eukprot:g2362.t1
MGQIITTSPNEAAVISGVKGTRFVIGGCGWRWLVCETVQNISLELMTLQIMSNAAETIKGVRVSCSSVAQIKVRALKINENHDAQNAGAGYVDVSVNGYDKDSIQVAATHFLGDSERNIKEAILKTMEGHQRQIIGTLTVEEIYKDRARFSERVREHVYDDLRAMGFELVSYTVTSVDDENGYMQALGATQTALVKREAAEGKARNEAEARKQVAFYNAEADSQTASAVRESHVSVNKQREQEAQSDRDLAIKKAAFDAEVNRARAQAENAGDIEQAKQDQMIVRERTQQDVVKAQVKLEVADKEVQRVKVEREGNSMAELLAEKNRAEAVRVKAEADSARIKMLGDADAAAKRSVGEAEATVLRKKADAWKEYGDAALVQMIVDKLPELAKNMTAPLSQTKEMVFVSSDGKGPSQLTNDVGRMLSQLPATVKGLTGLDIRDVMNGKKKFANEKPEATEASM